MNQTIFGRSKREVLWFLLFNEKKKKRKGPVHVELSEPSLYL